MILTTTPNIEGKEITTYLGLVYGETITGTNVFRDFLAGVKDIVGGRSGSYEDVLIKTRQTSIREMTERAQALGANAIIGIDLDYETINANMLIVTASGTAVIVR